MVSSPNQPHYPDSEAESCTSSSNISDSPSENPRHQCAEERIPLILIVEPWKWFQDAMFIFWNVVSQEVA